MVIKKVVKKIPKEYASKDSMDKLTEVVMGVVKSVDNLIDGLVKPVPDIAGTADMSKIKETAEPTPMAEAEVGGVEKMPIPPAWRKMVDEILGLDFGIDVVYPQTGSGFLFKIIVPKEKSNASDSYKGFYKVDIRTKAVSYTDGVEGIRKFCEAVKVNLSKK